MPTNSSPTPGNQRHAADVGVATERTELAWNRSGLAVLVCIAVLLRRLWPLDRRGTVVALVLIAAGAAVWTLALQAARLTAHRAPRRPMDETIARLLSLGTLALATGAFVLGFFPPR